MKRIVLLTLILLIALQINLSAQTISWNSTPNGYIADSITLNEPFTGGITQTSNPDVIYVSTGSYGKNKITKVTLSTKASDDVTSDVLGSVGGMTVLPTGELIIVDNGDNPASVLPGDCVLIARDLNSDGDFKDADELVKLIDPILVESSWGGFTGAQARTVPAGNPAGIPSGSLVFMDADALNNGDLFVVTDPTTSTLAAYRPSGASFWKGFDYNGGFDFDSSGVIYAGSTTGSFHGKISALKNSNGNDKIDAGEWKDVVTTVTLAYTSVSDVIIDREDDVLFSAMTFPYPAIMKFKALNDPLNEQASPEIFASLNAGWIFAIALNSKSLSFEPDTNAEHATLIIGGTSTSWMSAKNLLLLTAKNISSVESWNVYK